MSSVLVLRSVAGIAEGFRASWELTHVRLLSRVRSQVGLQVLQTTVRLPAALELKERRRLVRLYGLGRFRSRGWEEVIIGGWTPSPNQLAPLGQSHSRLTMHPLGCCGYFVKI